MVLELAVGSGSPSSPTGVTRSRSRSRGALLLIGLRVSASVPDDGGRRVAVPVAEGTKPGPWG